MPEEITGGFLDEHPFQDFNAARKILGEMGWVQTASSGSPGAYSEIRFFNKVIGGEGRLFHHGDGSGTFFGPAGWYSRWLRKQVRLGNLPIS